MSVIESRPDAPGGPRVLLVEANTDGTVGGSHQCLFDLATNLGKHGYTPVTLFYEDNPVAQSLRRRGIEMIVWTAPSTVRRETVAQKLRGRFEDVEAILRRLRFLRRAGIRLVHLNNAPGLGHESWLPAAWIAGIPCIAHARAAEPFPTSRPGRFLANRFDRIVAISRHIAQSLLDRGVPPERVSQIYDGVDLRAFREAVKRPADEVRASARVDRDAILGVMVGHLRPWKGHEVVLRALSLLEPEIRGKLRVLFLGAAGRAEVAHEQRLRTLVPELGLSGVVEFLGHRGDVADFMNAADFVLHASTDPEPFGLVVVEAMALGKPVIASNRGGPMETLDASSGIVFDPGDPPALARAIREICREPGLRTALGAAARERSRMFDVGVCVERIVALYSELLSRR